MSVVINWRKDGEEKSVELANKHEAGIFIDGLQKRHINNNHRNTDYFFTGVTYPDKQ